MIPNRLKRKEFRFCMVKAKTKEAFGKGWNVAGGANYTFDDKRLLDHISRGGNYGVVSGFGNLIIIDSDHLPTQKAIGAGLPKTFQVATMNGIHNYYICKDIEKKIVLGGDEKTLDKNGKPKHYGEVQADGAQVVGAGSTHPSGKKYAVKEDIEIQTVTEEDIKLALKDLMNKKVKLTEPEEGVIKNTSGEHRDVSFPITKIVNMSKLKSIGGGDYQGVHPEHGSTKGEAGTNFVVNPSKNLWTCHRCKSGGSPIQLLAVLEGIVGCEEFTDGAKPLVKGRFIKTQKIAEEKGLIEASKLGVSKDGLKDILLPFHGRTMSDFAKDIGEVLKDKEVYFYRPQQKEVVEIIKINKYGSESKQGEDNFTGFNKVDANDFITAIEDYAILGTYVKDKDVKEGKSFMPKSMRNTTAAIVLKSKKFKYLIPNIKRIFTVPLPIIINGKLTLPNSGYDERLQSLLIGNAPKIDTTIPLNEAKEIINEIFKEFAWRDNNKDKRNAIAGLLTPFLRGLYPEFNIRTPVFFYEANRARAGKDYCAGITGILYEGQVIEDPPISVSSKNSNNETEFAKKLMSALICGRKRMHLANNKGHIDNSYFEQIITSRTHTDRVLGGNDKPIFENELEFSMSGNIGVTLSDDLRNRRISINFRYTQEDANARVFNNPNLHGWVKDNRSKVLSALYSLVSNWFDKGMPKGTVPFTSYPDWAEICGGIMEAADYGNPCENNDVGSYTGCSPDEYNMKTLFSFIFEQDKGEQYLSKQEIKKLVCEYGEEIFTDLDLSGLSRADDIKFTSLIQKFDEREFSGIKMLSDDINKSDKEKAKRRTSRRKYMFTKRFNGGDTLMKHSSKKEEVQTTKEKKESPEDICRIQIGDD